MLPYQKIGHDLAHKVTTMVSITDGTVLIKTIYKEKGKSLVSFSPYQKIIHDPVHELTTMISITARTILIKTIYKEKG